MNYDLEASSHGLGFFRRMSPNLSIFEAKNFHQE